MGKQRAADLQNQIILLEDCLMRYVLILTSILVCSIASAEGGRYRSSQSPWHGGTHNGYVPRYTTQFQPYVYSPGYVPPSTYGVYNGGSYTVQNYGGVIVITNTPTPALVVPRTTIITNGRQTLPGVRHDDRR